MANKFNKSNKNTTKYGEFVCTEFKWLSLDKQKEKTEEMEKIDNQRKNKI